MNLDLTSFTYITGIASLLGLLLQVRDAFPGHREARKTIVVLVIGVFVGTLVSSLTGLKVDFGATVTPFHVLVAAFVSVLALVSIVAAFTADEDRRLGLFTFAGIGTFALFMLLAFGSVTSEGPTYSQVMAEKERISLEELLTLSSLAEARSDFSRALIHIKEAKRRLSANDERLRVLEQRESDLKSKQVAPK
jgi:hypothetical protein